MKDASICTTGRRSLVESAGTAGGLPDGVTERGRGFGPLRADDVGLGSLHRQDRAVCDGHDVIAGGVRRSRQPHCVRDGAFRSPVRPCQAAVRRSADVPIAVPKPIDSDQVRARSVRRHRHPVLPARHGTASVHVAPPSGDVQRSPVSTDATSLVPVASEATDDHPSVWLPKVARNLGSTGVRFVQVEPPSLEDQMPAPPPAATR